APPAPVAAPHTGAQSPPEWDPAETAPSARSDRRSSPAASAPRDATAPATRSGTPPASAPPAPAASSPRQAARSAAGPHRVAPPSSLLSAPAPPPPPPASAAPRGRT